MINCLPNLFITVRATVLIMIEFYLYVGLLLLCNLMCLFIIKKFSTACNCFTLLELELNEYFVNRLALLRLVLLQLLVTIILLLLYYI